MVIVPTQATLWLIQSVAAFPARDQLAPVPLYAVMFVAWLVWTLAAMRVGAARERLGMYSVVALAFLVPTAVTVTTYAHAGTLWQGRYVYPLSVGFVLVCGLVLDRPGRSRGAATFLLVSALAVVASTQLVGQLDVLVRERSSSPLAGTSAWLEPPTLLIVALTVAGCVLLGQGIRTPVGQVRPREDASSGKPSTDPRVALV